MGRRRGINDYRKSTARDITEMRDLMPACGRYEPRLRPLTCWPVLRLRLGGFNNHLPSPGLLICKRLLLWYSSSLFVLSNVAPGDSLRRQAVASARQPHSSALQGPSPRRLC